jgi:hypothetical protein
MELGELELALVALSEVKSQVMEVELEQVFRQDYRTKILVEESQQELKEL